MSDDSSSGRTWLLATVPVSTQCVPSGAERVRCSNAPGHLADEQALAFQGRYQVRRRLGTGGMGEVDVAFDRRLGRDVAVKVMRQEHSSASDFAARFEREARIQGQLEHPGVVPVHDLGVREDGALYFTMKRVRGLTLEQVVAKLAAGDPAAREAYGRRRLLSAFVTVCLTVEFAHRRGVLHRDLKPANLILGDFGEVHVLDWGIARVTSKSDAGGDAPRASRPDIGIDTGPSSPNATVTGAVVGTPGYMSPEQMRGEVELLDERSDIYSLGAILFELLALEPVHPRTSLEALAAATLRGLSDPHPSRRSGGSDVAPELDAICERALESDPAERFGSARELAEAVERYLDGAQDAARRKEMAAARVEEARQALVRADGQPEHALAERARAIRELSAAVALDPGAPQPLELLARAVTEPPRVVPPEAEAALHAEGLVRRRGAARTTARALFLVLLAYPLFASLAVQRALVLAPVFLVIAAYEAWAFWVSRYARTSLGETFVSALLGCGIAAAMSPISGPLVLAPSIALAVSLIIVVHTRADRPARWIVSLTAMASVLVPFLLSRARVIASSFHYDIPSLKGVIVWGQEQRVVSVTLIEIATLLTLLLPLFIVGRTLDHLRQAERRIFFQSWQLERLLPAAPPRA